MANLERRHLRNAQRPFLASEGARRHNSLRLSSSEEAPELLQQRPWRLFHDFADYCLFAIAAPVLQGSVVTVDFACQFLDAGREGELILGTGESPVLVAP